MQQARVRQEKKDLSKAVRNATKKQQRLRRRTRLMSSEDLVAALLMRKEAAERSARSREGNTSTAANGTLAQSSGDPRRAFPLRQSRRLKRTAPPTQMPKGASLRTSAAMSKGEPGASQFRLARAPPGPFADDMRRR